MAIDGRPSAAVAACSRAVSDIGERKVAQIDVSTVITVHNVMPDNEQGLWDYHTHGLQAVGHKEFQAIAPGFCAYGVNLLLHELADAVINDGRSFAVGERPCIHNVVCTFVEAPGDTDKEPTRLRIVDMPSECRCACCQAEEGAARSAPPPQERRCVCCGVPLIGASRFTQQHCEQHG